MCPASAMPLARYLPSYRLLAQSGDPWCARAWLSFNSWCPSPWASFPCLRLTLISGSALQCGTLLNGSNFFRDSFETLRSPDTVCQPSHGPQIMVLEEEDQTEVPVSCPMCPLTYAQCRRDWRCILGGRMVSGARRGGLWWAQSAHHAVPMLSQGGESLVT